MVKPPYHNIQSDIEDYDKCRKSVIIMPIALSHNQDREEIFGLVSEFLKTHMKVPQDSEEMWGKFEAVPVMNGNYKNRGDQDKVIVTFETAEIRDFIFSFAKNLPFYKYNEAPETGVKRCQMKIPRYLLGLRRKLNVVARKKREEGMYTSIRFDDKERSLRLLLRNPEEERGWSEYNVDSKVDII